MKSVKYVGLGKHRHPMFVTPDGEYYGSPYWKLRKGVSKEDVRKLVGHPSGLCYFGDSKDSPSPLPFEFKTHIRDVTKINWEN